MKGPEVMSEFMDYGNTKTSQRAFKGSESYHHHHHHHIRLQLVVFLAFCLLICVMVYINDYAQHYSFLGVLCTLTWLVFVLPCAMHILFPVFI